MTIPYPSIDSGYIYDPNKKLANLLSDFFEAEISQSYLFKGSISSLPGILQQNDGQPDATADSIRLQLEVYLKKYFDDLEVECATQPNESATTYDLLLSVNVRQAGETASLNQVLKIDGTKLTDSLAFRK